MTSDREIRELEWIARRPALFSVNVADPWLRRVNRLPMDAIIAASQGGDT